MTALEEFPDVFFNKDTGKFETHPLTAAQWIVKREKELREALEAAARVETKGEKMTQEKIDHKTYFDLQKSVKPYVKPTDTGQQCQAEEIRYQAFKARLVEELKLEGK